MSFKKTELVMLPTNEKANLLLTGRNDLYYSSKLSDFLLKEDIDTFQHLYFLSDKEEIKEGDWFLSNLNEILKCTKREDKFIWYEKLTVPGVSKVAQPFSIHINLKPKKIIATTDNSLEKICEYESGTWLRLPQPSQSFIEKFVEEYNKGNVITEVLVEYEVDDGYMEVKSYLKINPKDNTITIRKVKDSWNRDEVEEKIRKGAYVFLNGSIGDFDKWIEENL